MKWGAIFLGYFFISILPLSGQFAEAIQWREEGWKLQQEGDLDGALVSYKKAARLDQSYAVPYNDIGVIYEKKGLFEKAEKAYQRCVALDPNYIPVYANLGEFYENRGDLKKSLYYWKYRLFLDESRSPELRRRSEQKVAQLEEKLTLFNRDLSLRKNVREIDRVDSKRVKPKTNPFKSIKSWLLGSKENSLPTHVGQDYYDRGIHFFQRGDYQKAYDSFVIAQSYEFSTEDLNYYITVSKERMAGSGEQLERIENMPDVSEKDRLLAKDHFQMGLNYYRQFDFEKAYSQFSLAATYDPYDRSIQNYVDRSEIKMDEKGVVTDQMIGDLKDSRRAFEREESMQSPLPTMSDSNASLSRMSGFVIEQQDLSYQGLKKKAMQLLRSAQYEEALYVLKHCEYLGLSDKRSLEVSKMVAQVKELLLQEKEKKWLEYSQVQARESLSDVVKASILDEEGCPDWAYTVSPPLDLLKKEKKESVNSELYQSLDKKYSVDFKEADIQRVFSVLADMTGLNIVIDMREVQDEKKTSSLDVSEEGASKNYSNCITLRIKNMSLREIFDTVLRMTDYDWFIQGSVIWVGHKEMIHEKDLTLKVYDVSDIVMRVVDFPSEELDSSMGSSRH